MEASRFQRLSGEGETALDPRRRCEVESAVAKLKLQSSHKGGAASS